MIEEHLTFGQLEDYAAKLLPAEEIPAFHRHAEVCSACREMLIASLTGTEHLAEQQAVDYVAGSLAIEEKNRLALHLESCASCAAMVADLEEFRLSDELQETRPAPIPFRSRIMVWSLPIAAAIVAVVAVPAWLTLRPAHVQPHLQSKIVAELRDADGLLQLDASGSLTSPRSDSQLLAEALRTGRLPAGPPSLFTEQHETLRSLTNAAHPPILKAISPDDVRVLSERPEFRWLPLSGASSYEIAIYDENLNEIAHSGPIHETSWIPSTPLPRLKPLLWQIAATVHGARITAPAPPAAPLRFEIVAPDIATHIAEAQAANPPSHLLLAILYSQAGLHTEASAQLDEIARLNPDSPLVSALRGSLPAKP